MVTPMVNAPLTQSRHHPVVASSAHDQAQLALAIANDQVLQRLLMDSLPAIAHPYEVGAIGIEVGIPLADFPYHPIDGVLSYERIVCLLATGCPDQLDPPHFNSHNDYQALTCCQSELHTMAQNSPLSEVIALLAQAGFGAEAIGQILQLPSQAWHKSWWYSLDVDGYPTIPFQRYIRTRCFADGTVTLQYKDHYAREAPSHFHSYQVKLPVLIRDPEQSFGHTLEHINRARQALSSPQALLLADTLSELEAEGFMRQQVALFSPQALRLPLTANCRSCNQANCPLWGADTSPVVVCRAYTA